MQPFLRRQDIGNCTDAYLGVKVLDQIQVETIQQSTRCTRRNHTKDRPAFQLFLAAHHLLVMTDLR